jgi:putative membrane protein insertion efficiency factor
VNVATSIATGLVRGYQLIVSPWVTVTCKYHPSCSQYALDALRAHGVVRGTGLALWRFLRCNPWSRGGVDYVPARAAEHTEPKASHELPTQPART